MTKSAAFDYYYGGESNLFSFYRIPRQLITSNAFKCLSTDAKLLYGLLLDRMGLSAKHGWYDEQGRVYMRSEIIKFDRYQEQFRYLMKTRIETAEQLSMQYDAIQAEIDALTDQRRELYQWRWVGQGAAAIDGEIAAITDRLRTLRRELKLCARIEGDIPNVRECVSNQQADERGPEKEQPSRKPYLKNGR